MSRVIYLAAFLLIFILIGIGPINSQSTEWSSKSAMPTSRTEVVGAAIGNMIYAVGGFDSGRQTLSAVEAYDIEKDSWIEVSSLPIPLHHTTVVTYDGMLHVIGGYTTSPQGGWLPSDRHFVYRPESDTWSESARMPTARGALTAQEIDGRIYAIGGATSSAILATNEAYNPITDSWETVEPMPTPREHLASGKGDGKIYVIGGRTGGLTTNLDINEEYDPITDSWARRSPMPSRRGGLVGASAGGSIFIFGGESPEGTFGNNEQYFPSNDTWRVRQPMPTPRHGLAAVTVESSIYVIGGGPRPGFYFSSANEVFSPLELQQVEIEIQPPVEAPDPIPLPEPIVEPPQQPPPEPPDPVVEPAPEPQVPVIPDPRPDGIGEAPEEVLVPEQPVPEEPESVNDALESQSNRMPSFFLILLPIIGAVILISLFAVIIRRKN